MNSGSGSQWLEGLEDHDPADETLEQHERQDPPKMGKLRATKVSFG